jgi:dTDP-4-dehydrorhamnose 3,5-epimerase
VDKIILNSKHIKGNLFHDHRGSVGFVNECDLSEIKRMYRLTHHSTEVFRGWQGHQKEQKWFHCAVGSFQISVVQPNHWQQPTGKEPIATYVLVADEPSVLHLTGGYVTGIRAITVPSVLCIFSDVDTATSKLDDFRFPPETWKI